MEVEGTNVFTEEKVEFVADPSHPDRFLPRVSVTKKTNTYGQVNEEHSVRNFLADDMSRVLDFEQVPEAPADGPVRYCEDAGTAGLKFPVRHVCLRGGFLFYFDVQDVDDEAGLFQTVYHAPPLGVVPLEGVSIEFPPGGRRFFRDHAHHNDARNGYELVILHDTDDPNIETTRPPIFLVLNNMTQREAFCKALQVRSKTKQDTRMRGATLARDQLPSLAGETPAVRAPRTRAPRMSTRARLEAERTHRSGSMDSEDDGMEQALLEFGVEDFSEEKWLDNFFARNNDFDAPAKCRDLEEWQSNIKSGLKGAVKEQYVYFVDASRELTIMGRDINFLKEKVEKQNELIKDMKEIDFGVSFGLGGYDSEEDELEPGQIRAGVRKGRHPRDQQAVPGEQSDESSISSEEESVKAKSKRKKKGKAALRAAAFREGEPLEIPAWLEDAGEEISAFIKECRYTSATELLFKAKNEISEIFNRDKLTEDRLTKKQRSTLNTISRTLDKLKEWMSSRLVEGLRRKNEALKQAGKRERSDPLSLMAPMVSPICLDDDAIPLQLLVKLGKTQEAATAYAARRSLLLMESLHERPISGTGNVDIVIYAAQLSQSFFSCLASAVEGFLDLFLASPDANSSSDNPRDEDSASMLSGATRNVPPGALASIVLWADSELSKFSSAFGGTRILGNLALTPPPRGEPGASRMTGFEDTGDAGSKERMNAIDVAAQCVDQAFQYASVNLDSIGLPLTPRLAEYLRSRLKGCEAEVARKLDSQWNALVVDWEIDIVGTNEDIPMDERL